MSRIVWIEVVFMADNAKELMEALSRELHLSPEALQSSCERGSADELLKHVDSDKAKQVESILSDPQKTRELLDSPQARALMELLGQQ